MKNDDYWKNRFDYLENLTYQDAVNQYNEIQNIFESAQRDINKEIESWYGRFARNNEMSMQDARKLLNSKELKELKWDVNQYIKAGRENALDGRWMKELENASAKFHISRLEALKLQTQNHMESMFAKERDLIESGLMDGYSNRFYRTAFEIQKGLSVGFNVAEYDTNKVNRLLMKPWTVDGLTFSDRIWNYKDKMIGTLHQELTKTLIQGKNPTEAISSLTKFVDESVIKNANYNAKRLVLTESAFVCSEAQKDCFNDLSVERYKIVATLDEKTCDICGELDGQDFPMKDYVVGTTAPPFHPNCRTTTVPYFDDDFGQRVARDSDGKRYYVPQNMKYKDWKEIYVDHKKTYADWLKDNEVPTGVKPIYKPLTDNQVTELINVELNPIDFAETISQNGEVVEKYTNEQFYSWVDDYKKLNDFTLSEKELSIIEGYTEGSHHVMNEALRGNIEKLKTNGYSQETINDALKKSDDLAKIISRFDLNTDIVTHRVESNLKYLLGGEDTSIEGLKNLIGTEYTADGFTSSSVGGAMKTRFNGYSKNSVHIEIVTPKGTDGAYLHMSKKGETEFLYNKGTRFKVLDAGERTIYAQKYDFKTNKVKFVEEKEYFMRVQAIPTKTPVKWNFGFPEADLTADELLVQTMLTERDSIKKQLKDLETERANLPRYLDVKDNKEQFHAYKLKQADISKRETELNEQLKQLMEKSKLNDKTYDEVFVSSVRERLDAVGVEVKEIERFVTQPTTEQIIEMVGGGDMTEGSCASLGLAYIGNKHGYKVLDFRDGMSRVTFSRGNNLDSLRELRNAKVFTENGKNDIVNAKKLLSLTEVGKEYYLVTGKHASIVRKLPDGTLQYLELQSSLKNGWKSFKEYGNVDATLNKRFGCTKSRSSYGMVFEKKSYMYDIDSFKDDTEFEKLLGYINTAEKEQKKGKSGTIK